jgi:hypothetical protein
LEKAATGFDVHLFADDGQVREAITHRSAYGAIVFGDAQVTTLTATAASPAVAAVIPTFGQKIGAAAGLPAHNEDLRAFPDKDPKGVGLAAGALPLALGGWIGAMVIMMVVPSVKGRLVATAGVSVIAGLALVTTLQFVIGTFDGNFWLTSLAGMFGIAATCLAVVGLREFFGAPGLGIAAVLLVFLGNPLSGLATAPEMLPRRWGALGQLLPPGATGSLLRDVVFFNGHGAGNALIVLSCWLFGGVGLYLAGVRRNRRAEQVDIDEMHIGRHRVDQHADRRMAAPPTPVPAGAAWHRPTAPMPPRQPAWAPSSHPTAPRVPHPALHHRQPQRETHW